MTKNSLFGLLMAMVFCSIVSAQGQGGQPARSLPEGNGKSIVETACTTCHAVTMITNAGHTSADWKLLMERMVSAGAEVPPNQIAMVTDYLAKSFPEGDLTKACVIPWPVTTGFKEWTVPQGSPRRQDAVG